MFVFINILVVFIWRKWGWVDHVSSTSSGAYRILDYATTKWLKTFGKLCKRSFKPKTRCSRRRFCYIYFNFWWLGSRLKRQCYSLYFVSAALFCSFLRSFHHSVCCFIAFGVSFRSQAAGKWNCMSIPLGECGKLWINYHNSTGGKMIWDYSVRTELLPHIELQKAGTPLI